jgi:hypothetical protein
VPDVSEIRPRLAALAALTPGWLDGAGLPLADGAVPWLGDWLEARVAEGVPVPHLYLTTDGCLQAEWDVGHLGCEMTMDPEARRAEWWDFDAGTDGALDMQDPAAVAEWVAGWRARGVASA